MWQHEERGCSGISGCGSMAWQQRERVISNLGWIKIWVITFEHEEGYDGAAFDARVVMGACP